ncbi:MAG: DUF3833 domain-containing protein [Pseudomonadota bacterium]|nr:DUF3833 domain-containing protein [Pseudomonadota bacterium]
MITRIRTHLLLACCLLIISSCTSMKPEDFSDKTPRFILEQYFAGKTSAWGIFEDRFGIVRRQFVVEIVGKWDGNVLILDEHFKYQDGETQDRQWKIIKDGENSYVGTADDVIGTATGKSSGNALNWSYTMDLKFGNSKSLNVKFDDWMFLQPGGVVVNRARMSKLGIEIGQVSIFFKKNSDLAKEAILKAPKSSAELGATAPR